MTGSGLPSTASSDPSQEAERGHGDGPDITTTEMAAEASAPPVESGTDEAPSNNRPGIDLVAIAGIESELDQVSNALQLLDAEGPDAVERLDIFSSGSTPQ